jgi:hypothetical protein
MSVAASAVSLDLHGLRLTCRAPEAFLPALRRLFAPFETAPGPDDVILDVENASPSFERFPPLRATLLTPRSAVYWQEGRKIIDYAGQALMIEDAPRRFRLVCADAALAQHVFHLFVMALLGQEADRRGWLKIHAFAVAHAGRAFAVALPSGGGKSSLLLALLRAGASMVAEDMVLVDDSGRVRPLPFPIGVTDEATLASVPPDQRWLEKRLEGGDKWRVDAAAFSSAVTPLTPLGSLTLLSGVRLLNGQPGFRRVPPARAVRFLLRDAVLGVGLYQGLEYLLNGPAPRRSALLPVFFRRGRAALGLIKRTPLFEFDMSRRIDDNAAALIDFMNRGHGG